MPRYFADTHENGVLLRDDEGAELRGPEEARHIALETIADMAQAKILDGGRDHVQIDIRDAGQRVIYSVAVTLAGGWVDAPADRAAPETAIIREFLLGIVQSSAAHGEDAISRLEQFRSLQQAVTALAPGDANASDVARQIIAEINRLIERERSRAAATRCVTP